MEKISRLNKKKAIFIFLVLSLPIFLLTPSVSSEIPDYDVNSDGSCNILDIVLIANHLEESGTPGWIREDTDKNGNIDIYDIIFISNYYGTSGWSNDMNRIMKLSIAYSGAMGNANNRNYILEHFDVLDCPRYYTTETQAMIQSKPNLIIFGYYDSIIESSDFDDWNYVTQHEDWFLHDINGNRVQPLNYPTNYMMNPNSGWSNYYAQQSKQFLINNPQYDGIFSDDVITDFNQIGMQFTVPYSQIPASVFTNWGTWMYQHIQNTQTIMGNRKLMPNAWKYTQYSQDITNIHFFEGFIHHWSKAYNDNHYTVEMIRYAINQLHTQAELGNTIATNSGCANANAHPVEAKQWALFCYACLAFATVDVTKAYFSWQFFKDDNSHGWYPEMDIVLGQPAGDYYKLSNPNIYGREFANYYVVANFDLLNSSDVTFVLNGASYTLSPRTALFIPK
jgi:hypothetical protein